MKKKVFVLFFLLWADSLIFAQNDLSSTHDVTLGVQGYIGNALMFQGWGENHFIRNESIDNTANGRSRLRMYLTDDWAYDQGFEILAKRYDGPLRTLLYIPGDGSQTNFFSGASFGGNVGIGTINPTSKLTVAGNIASREVKVTVDAGADFVFEKDYDLPSLESVDKFIKENKHLPEIASAEEMKKDGINLSEMNIKLLQKIEEMTLYMIEMKKENKLLKSTQKLLEERIQKIENR
ncbi:hypothetical protein [Flavobacterium seoulense]|uniref:Uncharacterized protein n=1 Tax=Flavobacterium seoulense TaxID=1492738 RepID=A0A066WVL1_9FLAO|nr:hypothetical protein [Flavobacterium seoulense]KDN54705.1 hypothetical protein FEM21_22190 [Flavobacterium seoulense]